MLPRPEKAFMRRTLAIALSVACLSAAVSGFAAEQTPVPTTAQPPQSTDSVLAAPVRDPRWAVPIEKPGLPNLHKVTDNLYRGAQPTAQGFKSLKEMGIKMVVNLRSFHSDRDEMGGLEFGYEHIWVKAWHAEDKDLVRFLKIVTDKAKTPVFVHCEHGADRTGMMIAAYRIVVQGWSKEDALKEMTEGGFGWHPVWQNLIGHIRDLHVEALKKAAGLSSQPEQGSAKPIEFC